MVNGLFYRMRRSWVSYVMLAEGLTLTGLKQATFYNRLMEFRAKSGKR